MDERKWNGFWNILYKIPEKSCWIATFELEPTVARFIFDSIANQINKRLTNRLYILHSYTSLSLSLFLLLLLLYYHRSFNIQKLRDKVFGSVVQFNEAFKENFTNMFSLAFSISFFVRPSLNNIQVNLVYARWTSKLFAFIFRFEKWYQIYYSQRKRYSTANGRGSIEWIKRQHKKYKWTKRKENSKHYQLMNEDECVFFWLCNTNRFYPIWNIWMREGKNVFNQHQKKLG